MAASSSLTVQDDDLSTSTTTIIGTTGTNSNTPEPFKGYQIATTPVGSSSDVVTVNLTALTRHGDSPGLPRAPPFGRTNSIRSGSGGSASRRSYRNVGIVIGDFKGLYYDELTLTIGERIEIISKDTIVSRNIGWWTGRNDQGKIGIFPANLVKIVTSSTSVAPESEEETDIGQYPIEIPSDDVQLGEVIGIGGFGKVYKATYKGEDVAVKMARHTSYDTVKAISEVLSEAEKFVHLAHENICVLVGVCLVKEVCLVMEYAKGGPLSKVLHERNVSLPVDIILDWSKQIVMGMEYLHHTVTPSLIHRDLKSSNSKCKSN